MCIACRCSSTGPVMRALADADLVAFEDRGDMSGAVMKVVGGYDQSASQVLRLRTALPGGDRRSVFSHAAMVQYVL